MMFLVDGLRVDSMQQVNSGFWRPFQAAAGGIHAIGEVFNGDPAYTCPYQGQLSGVMNYPTFYTITNAFRSTNGDIQSLVNGINRMKVCIYLYSP
jgi:alpha-amylase